MTRLSVVTVVLNDPSGLSKTLESIMEQGFAGMECIVIDGGSTDNTADLIRKHRNRIDYSVSEPDLGPYDAMNKGLDKASGEWVIFLNAGDAFYNASVLSDIFSDDLSRADMIYGDCVADYRRFRVLKKAGKPGSLSYGMPFSHQSLLVRTALARQGKFSLAYPVAADYDMVYRLYKDWGRFRYFPHPIAVLSTYGISHRKMLESAREHFAILSRYHVPTLTEKCIHQVYLLFLMVVEISYRLFPMKVMLSAVKLYNLKRLV